MKQVRYVTAEDAVKVIKSGDRVHLSCVAVTPHRLIKAMVERGRAGELYDVKIQHLHIEGVVDYANPEFEGIFDAQQFFVGANLRKQTQAGYADYIPVFLSETQKLIREGYLKVNVAMIMVSLPDKHGYVSLGTSFDATLDAVEYADTVIALVNPNVPRAWGDAMIRLDQIDIFVEDDSPLYAHDLAPLSEMDIAIGKNAAALIEDGACLQMGIGGIPNAVLSQLENHKNLGVHTEMFADGILPLGGGFCARDRSDQPLRTVAAAERREISQRVPAGPAASARLCRDPRPWHRLQYQRDLLRRELAGLALG